MRARRETTTDDASRASDARDDASTPETSAKRDARYEYEIALGSSGWLFVYYVGVVKAMRERGMARCALKMFARCARGSERDGRARGWFGGVRWGRRRRTTRLARRRMTDETAAIYDARSKTKVYGTSGGALSGALLFMDCDLDALAQYVYICAARARRSVLGAFQLRAYCRGAMTEFCDPNAHELLSGEV
jgi:hypothetical protein